MRFAQPSGAESASGFQVTYRRSRPSYHGFDSLSERDPVSTLDRPAVLNLVKDRLADILEIEPTAIAEGASFVDDLDADSLALIELVEALEDEVGKHKEGFHIDDEDLEDLKTVRDAVDYVMAKL